MTVDQVERIAGKMLQRLRRQRVELPGSSRTSVPLAGLHADATDDPIAALVRAWARAGVNVDFYTSWLTQESALDTAVDRASIREIVRLIGYEPRPAVASSTFVAFTVRSEPSGGGSSASKSPGPITQRPTTRIRRGLPIQSVPSNGEAPQTFETSVDLIARASWSALRPASATHPPFVATWHTERVTVIGADPAPRAGDGVLFRRRTAGGDDGAYIFRVIAGVDRTRQGDAVQVRLAPAIGRPRITIVDPEVFVVRHCGRPFGAEADPWDEAPDDDREPVGTHAGWLVDRPWGRSWRRPLSGLPGVDVRCLEYGHDDVLYAGTNGKGVYRREAAGLHWTPLGNELEHAVVTAIHAIDDGRVLAGTHDERVFVWSPASERWEPLGDRVQRSRHGRRRGPNRETWPRGPVRSLLATRLYGFERIFAGTDRGVFRWVDERKGWRGVGSGLPRWDTDTARTTVRALGVDDDTLDVFAATSAGVFRSRWFGYNWRRRSKGLPGGAEPDVHDLVVTSWGRRRRPLMFAATESGVYVSADGGGSWSTTGAIDSASLPVHALAVGGWRTLYAGTRRGIFVWSPQERSWQPLPMDGYVRELLARPSGCVGPTPRRDEMLEATVLAGRPTLTRVVGAMPRAAYVEREWPGFCIRFPVLDVPSPKPTIAAGSTVVLHSRGSDDVVTATVETIESVSRSDFGLDGTVARLTLSNVRDERAVADPATLRSRFAIRDTDVWAAPDAVTVELEDDGTIEPVRGSTVRLEPPVDELPTGRWVAVKGTPARVRLEHLGGLHRLQDDGEIRPVDLAWRDIGSLALGPDGSTYVVLDAGRVWGRPAGSDEWRLLDHPGGDATAVAVLRDGRLVVADGTAIWHRDGDAWFVGVPPPDRSVRWLAATPRGGLLAGAAGSEVWEADHTLTGWERVDVPLPGGDVRAVAVGGDGALVVVTGDGRVERAVGDLGERWEQLADFAFTEAAAVAVAEDGSVMVGTRPVLRFRSTTGDDALGMRLVHVTTRRWAERMAAGAIPADVEHDLRGAVGELGHLRVSTSVAGAVVLFDRGTGRRYLVRPGSTGDDVFELPPPLEVMGGPRRHDSPADGVHGEEWELRDRMRRTWRVTGVPSIFSFVHAGPADTARAEIVRVVGAHRDELGVPELRLDEPLAWAYDGATVEINANVVEATAGVSVSREVLGNGDASRSNQTFALAQPHLTHLACPAGLRSSLTIEVGEVVRRHARLGAGTAETDDVVVGERWTEVDALVLAGPDDRVFEVRRDEAQITTVRFGDGVHGARLPTGHGNVLATYRHGAFSGELSAGQLTLLTQRPPGVTAAVNPIASSGGAPPEEPSAARRLAPATTRSMGRIVSVRDHAWFAESFPGVGRVDARVVAPRGSPVIHLSIASRDGSPIPPRSAVRSGLESAIAAARATEFEFRVAAAVWRWLYVDVRLVVGRGFDDDDVRRLAQSTIEARLDPSDAHFGVDCSAAEIVTLLQALPGVDAVELARLTTDVASDRVEPLIRAPRARWDDELGELLPGVLIAARPAAVRVEIVGNES